MLLDFTILKNTLNYEESSVVKYHNLLDRAQ